MYIQTYIYTYINIYVFMYKMYKPYPIHKHTEKYTHTHIRN